MVRGKLDGKISFEELRRLFDYDQATGSLRWREWRGQRGPKGGIAGTRKPRGHIEVKVYGVRYMAHRLIWVWMTGLWPQHEIDHRDTNPGNNAWENLREATSGQNQANRRALSTNQSGLKGVSPEYGRKSKKTGQYKLTGKWRAQIKVNGKVHYLGSFLTPEEASAAYKKAADQFFGVFARA